MVSPEEHGVLGTAKTEPFGRKDTHAPSSPFEIEGTKRKPWWSRTKITIAAALAAVAAGTGAYVADQQGLVEIPGIHQIIDNDNGARPFDIDKLDKAPQTVVDGINAHPATAEEFKNFISDSLPPIKTDIRIPADLPAISIMPSIDFSKAGKVEIRRETTTQAWGEGMIPVPINMSILIENNNTPIGIFLPQGINTETVEIFLDTPTKDNDGTHSRMLYEKFDLGSKGYLIVEIAVSGTKGLKATSITENAPSIDPDHPKGLNYMADIKNTEGVKLNIRDYPSIFTTGSKESELTIVAFYGGRTTIPNPPTQNGKMLYSIPR